MRSWHLFLFLGWLCLFTGAVPASSPLEPSVKVYATMTAQATMPPGLSSMGTSSVASPGMACAIINLEQTEQKPAEIISADGKHWLPPVRLDRCDHAQVTQGKVLVCYVRDNGQPTCDSLRARQTINADALRASRKPTTAFRAVVNTLISGDPHLGMAVHRFAIPRKVIRYYNGEAMEMMVGFNHVPGFPYGRILRPSTALDISLSGLFTHHLDQLSLAMLAEGQAIKVLALGPTKDRLVIDRKLLLPGATYGWVADQFSQKAEHTGTFSVLTEEEQRRVENAVAVINRDASLSDQTKTILRASLYAETDLVFDCEREMSNAGLLKRSEVRL